MEEIKEETYFDNSQQLGQQQNQINNSQSPNKYSQNGNQGFKRMQSDNSFQFSQNSSYQQNNFKKNSSSNLGQSQNVSRSKSKRFSEKLNFLSSQQLSQDKLQQLASQYGFNISEVKEIKKSFDQIGEKEEINLRQFRDSLGIIGLNEYLVDNIWKLIDEENKGYANFNDFLKYLKILMNGTQQEQAEWSFRMLSSDKDYQFISEKDIMNIVYNMSWLWNRMIGSLIYPSQEYVHYIFNLLDVDKDGYISLQDYLIVFNHQLEIFGWYEYLNQEDKKLQQQKDMFIEYQKRYSISKKQAILDEQNVKNNIPIEKKNKYKECTSQLKLEIEQIKSNLLGCISKIKQEKINCLEKKEQAIAQALENKQKIICIKQQNSLMEQKQKVMQKRKISRQHLDQNLKIQEDIIPGQFESPRIIQIQNPEIINQHYLINEEQQNLDIFRENIIHELKQTIYKTYDLKQTCNKMLTEQTGQVQEKKKGIQEKKKKEERSKMIISPEKRKELEEKLQKQLQIRDMSPSNLQRKQNDLSDFHINLNSVSNINIQEQNPGNFNNYSQSQRSNLSDLNSQSTQNLNQLNNQNLQQNYQQMQKSRNNSELNQNSVNLPKYLIKCGNQTFNSDNSQNLQGSINYMNSNNMQNSNSTRIQYGGNGNNSISALKSQNSQNFLDNTNFLDDSSNNLAKSNNNFNNYNNKQGIQHSKTMPIQENQQEEDQDEENEQQLLINPAGTRTNFSVYPGQDNFQIVLNMMIGIRFSIKKAFDLNDHRKEISSEKFKQQTFFELNYKQNDSKKKKKNQDYCLFYDYSPSVFERIRKHFGITNEMYLKSIGPEQMLGNLIMGNLSSLAEKCSTGKSNSFFYYSQDDQFMLKTIKKDEFFFFRDILKNYYNHLMQNKNTLISKIFGLHKIKIGNKKDSLKTRRIYFVIMGNLFQSGHKIHVRYDLKGSTFNRTSKVNGIPPKDISVALKDCDWLQDQQYLNLSEENIELLKEEISKDTKFFVTNQVNDYSLLVGFHKLDEPVIIKNNTNEQNEYKIKITDQENNIVSIGSQNKRSMDRFYEQYEGGMLSKDGKQIIFLGIIDIFTKFGLKKKWEYKVKKNLQGGNISCIPYDQYGQRFKTFMYEKVLTYSYGSNSDN